MASYDADLFPTVWTATVLCLFWAWLARVSCGRPLLLCKKGWGVVSLYHSPCHSWFCRPSLFLPFNSQVISFPDFRGKVCFIIPYIKMLQIFDFSHFWVRRQTVVPWMLEIIWIRVMGLLFSRSLLIFSTSNDIITQSVELLKNNMLCVSKHEFWFRWLFGF